MTSNRSSDANADKRPTKAQRAAWSSVLSALAAALDARRIELEPRELHFVTRFLLEELEDAGHRIVPVKPTKAMLSASRRALKRGKRLDVVRVDERTKHRWRLMAAIEAACDWRPAEEADREP